MYGSPSAFEACAGLVAADLDPLPRPALGELAAHLLLDRGEVLLADRLGKLEVVVEAVLDRRADRDLDAGMEPAHGLGQQMRRGVTQDVERVRVVVVPRREELQGGAVGQRQAQVARLAVDPREDGLLGELRADRAGGVERARSLGELERGAVGERHVHVGPG